MLRTRILHFIGRLKVSFGKTIDLKTLSTSDCWSPSLCKHLIVCSHGLSLMHCINLTVFFSLSVVSIRMESCQRRKFLKNMMYLLEVKQQTLEKH